MALYLGYYRAVPHFLQETQERARGQSPAPDPKFQRLVIDLLEKLPAGCKIIGSYVPMAGAVLADHGPPSIMLVETDNLADLSFISQYYTGYLLFHWVPGTRVGVTRQEREAWAAAQARERESWAAAALLDGER